MGVFPNGEVEDCKSLCNLNYFTSYTFSSKIIF